MKKMKPILIVLAVILVLALILFVALWLYSKNHIMDGPGMVNTQVQAGGNRLMQVYYTVSGDMEGGYYQIVLEVDEKDPRKVSVVVSEQETHNSRERVTKKKVDAACCDSLQEIIDFYDMLSWKDLPPDEIFALDEAHTTISFAYVNRDSYTISSTQALPDTGREAFVSIRECMLEYAGICKE